MSELVLERSTFEFLAQQLALRHHNVITVKPILIPEEPRLVKPKLHLVKEKTMKNMLPKSLYEPLERAGDVIPWKSVYEEETYSEVYWIAHNASCFKVGVPKLWLTDETLVASGFPLDLEIPPSHCYLPQFSSIVLSRLRNGICYMKEYLAQSGLPLVASLVSKRYRSLDEPISKMFAEDYTFPDINSIKQQSSMFFINTDSLLEYPRAIPPHVIPVGGLHIDHPKPLFSPWNTTIESAEAGMIIVSLGTQANSAKMTDAQLTKYRIYWSLISAMKTVLNSPKYKMIAKDISKEFRSRPSSAFSTALYYIERVGRYHGNLLTIIR
uniref:glucuronosyltransferase n=1 Tax=Heterorhabditis bacteriophora TaxID=37862 RepID=A0A1I7X363_HETBA